MLIPVLNGNGRQFVVYTIDHGSSTSRRTTTTRGLGLGLGLGLQRTKIRTRAGGGVVVVTEPVQRGAIAIAIAMHPMDTIMVADTTPCDEKGEVGPYTS